MDVQSHGASMHGRRETKGLPVKTGFMFSNLKGVEKKGIKKRQLKLLKKLGFLPRFLRQDEEILLVTTACSPITVMEQLTTGWVLFYLKRALLVFTNKRILHIPTTLGYDFRHSVAQIGYNDIDKIKMGWRALKLKYRNGKKENFLYVHGRERKKIRALVSKLKPGREPSPYRKRYHLCPSCTSALQSGSWNCPSCRLEFKNSGRARLLSILIPGGGYFYTGHWFLGLGDFVVESSLLVMIATTYLNPQSTGVQAGLPAVILVIILVIEKLITIYHAEHYIHEYIPLNRNYPKRTANQSSPAGARAG